MKYSKTILMLLLPILLVGCTNKKSSATFSLSSKEDISSSEVTSSIDIEPSSNPSSGTSIVSSSSEPSVNINDVLLYDNKTLFAGPLFKLEEFSSSNFVAVPHEDDRYNFSIYLGETLILEEAPMQLFASDINKDEYRELVYIAGEADNEGVLRNFIHVYDIKNAKEIALFSEEELGTYYRSALTISNNRLIVSRFGGPYLQDEIDYGYFTYSETKKVALQFKNKYDIDSLNLVSVTLNNPMQTPVEITKGDKNDYYALKEATRYLINIEMHKKEGSLKLDYPNANVIMHKEDLGDISFNHFEFVSSKNGIYQFAFGLIGSRQKDIVTFIYGSLSFYICVETN